ncbi:MAG: M23 family metallopeptidase [Elusimicrobia bacterium]|nr:M23 family metallopeptidase [Elusimicrobiota bacterium]
MVLDEKSPDSGKWGSFARAGKFAAIPVGCLALLLSLSRPSTEAPVSAEWARFSVVTPAGPAEPNPEVLRRLNPLVFSTHKIGPKEANIWALAKRYGTTVPSLQVTNDNELFLIHPGMTITVHNKKGMLYTVKKDGESLDSIIGKFRRDAKEARKLKEQVVDLNELPGTALLGTYELSKGEYLLLPGVSKEFDTYRFPFGDGGWTRISSGFGRRRHPILKTTKFHDGWDLPKPYGTPVYPSRSGRVAFAGWKGGYGQVVEVRHNDGASTLYGHLSHISASEGQWVERGKSLIGRVGSTGLSTGPHLHFEVRDKGGHAVNPRSKIGRR